MRFSNMTEGQMKLFRKINMLKQKLNATDYQAIKYAEGEMSASDYAPVKAQRKGWREEINTLEAQLQAMMAE